MLLPNLFNSIQRNECVLCLHRMLAYFKYVMRSCFFIVIEKQESILPRFVQKIDSHITSSLISLIYRPS